MSSIRLSDPHYRRVLLLHERLVPALTEIEDRMGAELAEAFFETCIPVIKRMVGTEPELVGPGDELWISPSDILIGKVKLKPPFTSTYIKALTHQGILEIGKIVEEKVERQHERDKENAVAENEKILMFMAEKMKNEAVDTAIKKEQKIFEAIIEHLKKDFQKTLKKELQMLENKHKEELIIAVEQGKEEAKKEMDQKLEIVIQELFRRLTEQFATELLKQSQRLHQHFWYHLKQEQQKLQESVEAEKKKCTESLAYLRHELHCENISNVMYVLANMNRINECDKQALEQNYLAKLNALEKELDERTELLNKLIEENKSKRNKIQAREALLFELVKQFQKFVYFALKAVPTQAEFLLDVEKLMIFEFTKTVIENTPGSEASFIAAYQSDSSSSSSRTVTTVTDSEVLQPMPSRESLPNVPSFAPVELPTVMFNENLYIREDFRNMISQGLQISKSNENWNSNLMKLSELIAPKKVETESKITLPTTRLYFKTDKLPTNVTFSVTYDKNAEKKDSLVVEEKFLKSLNYGSDNNIQIIQIPKENEIKTVLEMDKTSKTNLETASECKHTVENIITDLLEPAFKPKITKRHSTFEKHRDSLTLIRDKMRSALSVDMPRTPRKSSKLVEAKDSLILLKSRESFRKQRQSFDWHDDFYTTSHKRTRNVGVQYESPTKTVKISHFEIIPEAHRKRTSCVTFFPKPEIITADSVLLEEDLKEVSRGKIESSQEFPSKKENALKIAGDWNLSEHLASENSFTLQRMHSLGKIFRKNPSLCRLFTQAIKN